MLCLRFVCFLSLHIVYRFIAELSHDSVLFSGIGRFGEAGLHEYMPFVIFRAKSRERSQRHFRTDFCVGVASRCV